MIKYEVLSDRFSEQGHFSKYGLSSQDVIDLYNGLNFTDPVTEGSFDTEAEAIRCFEDCKQLATSHDRGAYAEFRIIMLQRVEIDEDGDPVFAVVTDDYAVPLPADVFFEGGESRYNPEKAVDYMLVNLTDGTELYAEAEPVDGAEWANFDALKAEILDQAAEKGISPDRLHFFGE